MTEEITGVIDLIGRPKDFGQNKRVNIRLTGAPVEWISLVSSEGVVEEFLQEYEVGDRISAICKAHEGKDPQGNPREELWIQEVSKVKEAPRETRGDTVAVDKHFIETLKRAAKVVDESRVAKTNAGRDFLVAAVFLKSGRE
jgi:hypothetical protein